MVRRVLVIAAALAAIGASPAQASAPFVQQAEAVAADGAAGDTFGLRSAVSRDTLVTISPSHKHDAGSKPGAVYVFERPASGWAHARQTAELSLPEGAGAPSDVAISGDTIAVGFRDKQVGANAFQGAVSIFVKPATGWKDAKATAELTASDGVAQDALGFGVAMSGDALVTTSRLHKVGDNAHQGAAYVFVKPASGWATAHETAELTTSDGAAQDSLGPVAIDGDTIVAASFFHKVGDDVRQGEAYVFVKPATGWASSFETARLTSRNGAAGDGLGQALAISGDTVVAGVPGRTVGAATLQGTADVFTKPAAGWQTETQAAELTASDGTKDDLFGGFVGVSGDKVISGAPFRKVGDNARQGAGYLFVRQGTTWVDATETQRLTASDGRAADAFGATGLMSGDAALMGAPFRNEGDKLMVGALYVFGSPPSIAINRPSDGATFTQGRAVSAAYTCAAASCIGPVASGARIDTSTLGTHTFTVDAVDRDGIAATKSVSYTVVAAPSPSITALKQSARRWRARGKRPLGTTFSFRLDQPARVALRFGRRGKSAGVLSVNAHAGLNKVRFQGRISRKRKLAPGRYTLQLSATNAAGKSAASRRLRFAIVRR